MYLIHLREFISLNVPIFKVGKTKQSQLKRFLQYPKGSELLLHLPSSDCDTDEQNILRLFRETYVAKMDIGHEYFEGDADRMVDDMCRLVRNKN